MKPSALQQTVNNLLAQTHFASNLPIGNVLDAAKGAFATATNHLANLAPPQPRRAANSQPIATMKNGSTLYSDGSTKPGQTPAQLAVLRQNVFDQHAFTPQAQQYLASLPLYYGQSGTNDLGRASTEGGASRPDYGIAISPDAFTQGPTTATEVLTHEFMHSLDANVNQGKNPFADYVPKGATSANSYDFFPNEQANSNPTTAKEISAFLAAYARPDKTGEPILQPQTADQEAFAQYAGPRGEKVLLGPMKDQYGAIFSPESKIINYSPVNPISSGNTDLFNQFNQQDAFGR